MLTFGERSMCDTMLCACLPLRLVYRYSMLPCFTLLFRLLICDIGLRHLTVVRLILCLLTVLDYIGYVPGTSLCGCHCYLRLPYVTVIFTYLHMFNSRYVTATIILFIGSSQNLLVCATVIHSLP